MRKKKVSALMLIISMLFLSFCHSIPVIAAGGIFIDTVNAYEGMEASFSQGYEPSIQDNTMNLVVPFLVKKEMKSDSILVGISFEKQENSPFYFQNYQKQVKQSENGIYLYQCNIKLKENRSNGQYPLLLSVQAETAEGILQQEFRIYVEITDGKEPTTQGPTNQKPATQEPTGQEPTGKEPTIQEPTNQEPTTQEPTNQEPTTQELSGQDLTEQNTSQEEVNHQPRVIISKNSLQGSSIEAATSIMWNLSAKNCSSSRAVENMKVTLLSDNTDILFEKNVWYFERVSAGKTMDLSQNVYVERKAAAGQIPVQLQFEYEDSKGNSYTSTETVNLIISQSQQAELANIAFPESVYASDTNSLTFQVHNTGLAVIYNAKVRLEGTGLFPTEELFLGNLEAGTSVDGEIPVFAGTLDMDEQGEISQEGAEKYGITSGKVIFSYEDEKGEVIEQTMEIKTEIKEPETVELKVEKDEPETNQWWITIIFIIILVLVLVILWLSLRIKYFRKRVELHEKS